MFDKSMKTLSKLNALGRSCPLGYHMSPKILAPSVNDLKSDLLFVVGGLYGNIEALNSIDRRVNQERNHSPMIVFNGDFNFFNYPSDEWETVNNYVMKHQAIVGNVEVEAVNTLSDDCGCAYPMYVPDAVVERSNLIVQKLRQTSLEAQYTPIANWLRSLTKHLIVRVGNSRIGILHGDVKSLSGWSFAVEAMEPLDVALRSRLGCSNYEYQTRGGNGEEDVEIGQITTQARVLDWFAESNVDCFACTHTCLPFGQKFQASSSILPSPLSSGNNEPNQWGAGGGVVINNGSAGMPNFSQMPGVGIMTRIAKVNSGGVVPEDSLYGTTIGNVRIDAIPISYDHDKWLNRFQHNWPENSPAHESYFNRIQCGGDFGLYQAARSGFELNC